jgi:hypothetical protein
VTTSFVDIAFDFLSKLERQPQKFVFERTESDEPFDDRRAARLKGELLGRTRNLNNP